MYIKIKYILFQYILEYPGVQNVDLLKTILSQVRIPCLYKIDFLLKI